MIRYPFVAVLRIILGILTITVCVLVVEQVHAVELLFERATTRGAVRL